AWFCPQEKGILDADLIAAIRGEPDAPADWQTRMRAAGINHVIVFDTNRDRLFAAIGRMLEDPQQWPLLYVKGYLAVFGWRDPAAPAGADPFRGWHLDLDRLAFRPTADRCAPRHPPEEEPEPRQWWEAFWKPARPRPVDQDEASLYLMHAEHLKELSPQRHLV